MALSVEERFWPKVDMTAGPDACWPWTAYCMPKGYGRFGIDASTNMLAHRMAWELMRGPIPDGMEIDHRRTCPKRCCNPAHLRTVTHKQNGENRAGPRRDNTSGVHGVTWHRASQRWQVKIKHDGDWHWVGRFDTLEEADAAARAKRNELFTHNDADR